VNFEKKILLLVEDDAVTGLASKTMLERNGYSVITAMSGEKAIEIALNNKIDLILMDIELGGDIDGNKAAQEILSKKNIPVLFLTAHVEREMVEKVRRVTRYGYALKNSGEHVLLSSIEMAFDLYEAYEKTRESEEQMKVLLREKEQLLRELNCLYNISRNMEESTGPLDHLLARMVLLVPEALSNPDCSYAVISYNGQEYVSSYSINPDVVMERDLIINGNKAGLLTIGCTNAGTDCQNAFFDDKDKDFLNTVTERIGKIIELFIAKDELRKLEREVIDISERERQKIGHELHDSLGQILTGVSFMLKTVKNQLNGSPPALIERVGEISGLVHEATQVCRQITRGLPLVTIQHNTLILALDQLAISTRDIFNINCEVKSYGTVDVEDDFVSSQLYRITQEAVNNAVKHSGAKNIFITINNSSGILLTIRDDGLGNELQKRDQGMGLGIMKYRADLINGEFSAVNDKDCGFVVSVRVP